MTEASSWRDHPQTFLGEYVKAVEGENIVELLDDGTEETTSYGPKVIFKAVLNGLEGKFSCPGTLLREVNALKNAAGVKLEFMRVGSGQDTKYKFLRWIESDPEQATA